MVSFTNYYKTIKNMLWKNIVIDWYGKLNSIYNILGLIWFKILWPNLWFCPYILIDTILSISGCRYYVAKYVNEIVIKYLCFHIDLTH